VTKRRKRKRKPKKPEAKKPEAKAAAKAKKDESSDDDDSDDSSDEEEEKPAAKVAETKEAAKEEEESDDDSSDDSDDDEEEKPKAKEADKKTAAKKKESSSEEESSDDDEEEEEEEKKPAKKNKSKENVEPMDTDEPIKMTNNKNKNKSDNAGSGELTPGTICDAYVVKCTTFGCFVALDGFDNQEGLVHISQLSREGRVETPEEVVQVDQKVKVKVLPEKTPGKLSLTIKDVDQETGEDLNPNNQSRTPGGGGGRRQSSGGGGGDNPAAGTILDAQVVSITTFGAFVALDGYDNKQGLVHISQLSREGRVETVEEVLSQDQKVKIKVLNEKTPGKMSLTMKDVDQETGEDLYPDDPNADPANASANTTPSGRGRGGRGGFGDRGGRGGRGGGGDRGRGGRGGRGGTPRGGRGGGRGGSFTPGNKISIGGGSGSNKKKTFGDD